MTRYQFAINVMRARSLASLLLLTLATNASAGLYKYVGPDGTVVYSDRPPVNPMPHVQVFSAGVPRAVAANETGYLAPKKPDPVDAPVRQAAAPPTPAPAVQAQPAAPDARAQQLAPLLPGLRIAMDQTTLIDRSVDLCILTAPKSFRTYVAAQDAWKGRNAAVTARVGAVLSELVTGNDRLRLEQDALEHTSARLLAVRALSSAQRVEWCGRTAEEMGAGKADLAGMPGMRPLLQYQSH
jgi:hypothetical protein